MPIALRLDAIFGENPANVRLRNDIGSGYSLKMRTFGANADMVYKFRWSSRGGEGYLLGGIGYCTASLLLSFGESSGGAGDNKFAWNAGGGLIFPIARVAMFLELRYYNVATAFDFAKLPFVALTTGVRWGRKAA
jgi:glucose uptake protein GlcU